MLLVAWASSACTVLSSETTAELTASRRAPGGVHYALPRGLVDIELKVSGDGAVFELNISDPKFVPDPQHRYFLRYRPHPSYDDDITISLVGDGRPFLKTINSKTVDQTKDILVNLAKAAAFAGHSQFQNADGRERLLGQVTVDPSDPRELAGARGILEGELRRYLGLRIQDCRRNPEGRRDECRALERLQESGRRGPLLTLGVSHTPQARFGKPADCSVGVCYRPKEPFLIAFSIGGVTNTKIVELPNAADPIAIDIGRAFLVHKIHTLSFDDDGFLTSAKVEKGSELLAAVQLPLEAASAVAAGLQLRIDLTENKTRNAKAEADIIRKQAELRAARDRFQSAPGIPGEGSARSYKIQGVPDEPKAAEEPKSQDGEPPPLDPGLRRQRGGVRP